MFKIIGKSRHARRGREVIDRTEVRADAETLRDEYQLAFGRDWDVSIMDTPQQQQLDEIAKLRAEGLTNSQIGERIGRTHGAVDQLTGKLARAGVIPKRKAGKQHSAAIIARNNRIAELRNAGVNQRVIAAEVGLNYFSVRAIVHKLRKQGIITAE